MVCDQGLRPRRLCWHTALIPVRGFSITTSSAQPVETQATTITTAYRSIRARRARSRSEAAALWEKYEFGSIVSPARRLRSHACSVDARALVDRSAKGAAPRTCQRSGTRKRRIWDGLARPVVRRSRARRVCGSLRRSMLGALSVARSCGKADGQREENSTGFHPMPLRSRPALDERDVGLRPWAEWIIVKPLAEILFVRTVRGIR
jgi:hypothetical protein